MYAFKHNFTEVQPDLEEYIVRDLQPNTLYEISVQVFNKVGTGPSSSPRVVQSTRFEGLDVSHLSITSSY